MSESEEETCDVCGLFVNNFDLEYQCSCNHYPERDELGFVKNWQGEGTCCFCGEECDILSQDCGCQRRY